MGQPLAEIEKQLGRTHGSVTGLLLRGQQRLRELLADLEGDAP
jgi:hypothetical protein